MSKISFVKKYNYLLRFVVSLCIALYVPALIFGFLVVRRSYDGMKKENEKYYLESTASFATYFNDYINDLENHALSIALNNIESDSKIRKETIETHPYYYFTATRALSDYRIGLSNTVDLGLHFSNTDYILTSTFKYTINDFIEKYKCTSTFASNQMTNFFNGGYNETLLLSTFGDKALTEARLFIGIPVTMNYRYKAQIFYILRHNSIRTTFFKEESPEHPILCLFDYDGDLVFTNKEIEDSLLQSNDFRSFIIDNNADNNNAILYYSDSNNEYTIFKVHDRNLKKIFVSVVAQDQVEENFTQFYNVMRKTTISIAIAFLLTLTLTVYLNYKPILNLVQSISKNTNVSGDSEIKTISRVFDNMEEHITEQRIMLMDYILGNLLYGFSIPQTDAERLDINLHGGKFVVLTISDLKLDTLGRTQLAEFVLLNCNTHAYITDILHKDHMVLICVIKDTDVTTLIEEVKEYLDLQYKISYKIGSGHIVDELNDIRKSYMNALYEMEITSVYLDTQNTEISLIDGYPVEDIMLFLHYVQSGETENALKTLSTIVEYISQEIDTVLMRRYMCYDILITYIKRLKQMKYILNKKEMLDLVSHNDDINQLHSSLKTSVICVCESVKNNQKSLPKKIIEYIDENFTNPNISRTQVADHFNISIYSLSRLFKDDVGIGFTEYITAKRLEKSRNLLLTTAKNIGQISLQSGFNNPGYFSKVFKVNYGLSPSEFRDQSN